MGFPSDRTRHNFDILQVHGPKKLAPPSTEAIDLYPPAIRYEFQVDKLLRNFYFLLFLFIFLTNFSDLDK